MLLGGFVDLWICAHWSKHQALDAEAARGSSWDESDVIVLLQLARVSAETRTRWEDSVERELWWSASTIATICAAHSNC